MSQHALLAYQFDGKGGGRSLTGDSTHQVPDGDGLVWIHMDVNQPETRTWLEGEIAHLDPYIIDALLEEETRPRMIQIKDGAMMILRGVNLNENADPEDMVSIRLWVEKHRVISVRRRRLKAVRDIEESIKAGKGPKDAGHLVCMLLSRLFKRIEPVLTELDETTDDIEESLLESVDVSLREAIIDVRKQAIMFRRYMVPQRDAVDQLRMSDVSWLEDRHRRQLQENYNRVTRYLEDLDAIRERAQIVKDELANILSDRLNKNMYMLSVIAAVFLPLGFLTGLLGINVGGIPGADNEYAFVIFCAFLFGIVAFQIYLFKRLKWF
ncbi:MAG: zinc transporter ZntB [Akkermansiaceae bacterium]|nr:zinc transporter ZntB [Akkermansiaceae bacterium]